MFTKIFKIDRENINKDYIKAASETIVNGDLVAFPTETVYGLGADGLNASACEKIFTAKGRPSDNPLILHISDKNMLYNLVDDISLDAEKLMDICWPGPLTIIFKKKDIIPDIVSANLNTVAIRFPSDEIARELIKLANTPIAAPSANLSGSPSPTRASDVFDDLNEKIPLILDGGDSNIGIESTVIDLSGEIPYILRPGYYTYEYIKEILPNVKMDEAIIDVDQTPKSPGQKYKHYAPKADLEVYVGEDASLYMVDTAYDILSCDMKVGIITFDDTVKLYDGFYTLSFGDRSDLESMSHNLFTYLRMMDEACVDFILAEGVNESGLGKSIMNRMRKSANGDVFYINEEYV